MLSTGMQAWINKAKQKKQSALQLLSIIGTKPNAYLRYRLRFFLINSLLTFLIHTVEFFLIFNYFDIAHASLLFMLRGLSLLAQSLWWGALETLRSRVRTLYQEKTTTSSARILGEIRYWLSLSFLPTLLFGALGIFWLWSTRSDALVNIYALCIFLQTGIMLLTRTLHSGAFAVQRVFRPFWSIVLPEIGCASLLLLFWPFFNVKVLPAVALLQGLLSAALTVYYSMRTYRQLGFIPSWRLFAPGKIPARGSFSPRITFLRGFASMGIAIESLLMLSLLRIPRTDEHLPKIWALYLLLPLLQASFNWIRLFYFDLQKLARPFYKRINHYFFRQLNRTSLCISIALFFLASGLSTFYLGQWNIAFTLSLGALFLLRSYLATEQMIAFCHARYIELIVSTLLVLLPIPFFYTRNTTHDLIYDLWFLNLSFFAAFLFLRYLVPKEKKEMEWDEARFNFYEHLIYLSKRRDLLQFTVLVFSKKNSNGYRRAYLPLLKKMTQVGLQILRLAPHLWLTIEPRPSTAPADTAQDSSLQQLLIESGGTLTQLSRHPSHFDNNAALHWALETAEQAMRWNQPVITAHSSVEALYSDFLTLFPKGFYVDLKTKSKGGSLLVPDWCWGRVQSRLDHFLESPLGDSKADDFECIAAIQEAELRAIFVVAAKDYPRTQWQHFKRSVHQWNLSQLLPQAAAAWQLLPVENPP